MWTQEYASVAKPGMLTRKATEYKAKAEVNALYSILVITQRFLVTLSSIFKALFWNF